MNTTRSMRQPDRINLRSRLAKMFAQCRTPDEERAMLADIRAVVDEFEWALNHRQPLARPAGQLTLGDDPA